MVIRVRDKHARFFLALPTSALCGSWAASLLTRVIPKEIPITREQAALLLQEVYRCKKAFRGIPLVDIRTKNERVKITL